MNGLAGKEVPVAIADGGGARADARVAEVVAA
jgi:hypothetical protein